MKKVQTGRVIEFYSNRCLVEINGIKTQCAILGKQDIVVGDFVDIELQNIDDPNSTLIKSRGDRSSELIKRGIRDQRIIAANISHVGILLVQNPKTSTEFIDKWITSAKSSNIEPFIINNKIDLEITKSFQEKVNIYEKIGIQIFNISAKEGLGVESLSEYLKNKCTIFVGNSGAGKSTLTSQLTGFDIKTKELSKNQGVHTTSISSLYTLQDNIEIIDSPGVRDIPIEGFSKNDIFNGFFEINEASKSCKFSNCSHGGDLGCSVDLKIKNGEINKSRYNNFINFLEQISYE
jgi:ribosome biogenesis GTPase